MLAASGVSAAQRIPLEDLFADPQFAQVQLSPDGHLLVLLYQAPDEVRRSLVVMDMDTSETQALAQLEQGSEVHEFQWIAPRTLYFAVTLQDLEGGSSFHSVFANFDDGIGGARFTAVDAPLTGIFPPHLQHPYAGLSVGLIDPLPSDPESILVAVSGVPVTSVGTLVMQRADGSSTSIPVDGTTDPDALAALLLQALQAASADAAQVPSGGKAGAAATSSLGKPGRRTEPVRSLATSSYAPPRSCSTPESFAKRRELDPAIFEDMDAAEVEEMMHLPEYPHVVRVNFERGTAELVEVNPGRVVKWIIDPAGEPRMALSLDCDLTMHILYREAADAAWSDVRQIAPGSETFQPLAFEAEGERVFVLTNAGRDTQALSLFDLRTGSLELVQEVAGYDIEHALFGSSGVGVLAIVYSADRPMFRFLDDRLREIYSVIENSLPDSAIALIPSMDYDRFLVTSFSDLDPGMYYLYTREDRELRQLFAATDALEDFELRPISPVSFAARDGRVLHGYLTQPDGVIGPQPTVVMVHGGPFGVRDEWLFNPEVQYLVDAGYTVLQVNYRGSGGYGRSFMEEGWRQWGGLMQDDVADGTRWLYEQGIADPDRTCIYGASYGGYAAIMGVIRYPEMYRCAASWAGVMDLAAMVQEDVEEDPRAIVMHRLLTGDPITEEAAMRDASPVYLADRVQVPVFIAHGSDDDNVSVDQSRRMVEALREAGRHGRSLFQSETGHNMDHETQRLQFYRELEQFLDANIGAGDEGER